MLFTQNIGSRLRRPRHAGDDCGHPEMGSGSDKMQDLSHDFEQTPGQPHGVRSHSPQPHDPQPHVLKSHDPQPHGGHRSDEQHHHHSHDATSAHPGQHHLLTVENLSVSFQMYDPDKPYLTARQHEVNVIDNLSVSVHVGEIVAVVGASGSGKTLLADSILGLFEPNALVSGHIWFDGDEMDARELGRLRGHGISLVPQSVRYLDPLMKVGRQVEGFARRRYRTNAEADVKSDAEANVETDAAANSEAGVKGKAGRNAKACARGNDRGSSREKAEGNGKGKAKGDNTGDARANVKESAKSIRERLFARYDLDPAVADMYPFQLSGGMARRILLCCALMDDPKLIIADEPTPGLDLPLAVRAMDDFRAFADSGGGVLLITHDIELALRVANRIAVFKDGTVVEETAVANFASPDLLRSEFARELWHALPEHGFRVPAMASDRFEPDRPDAREDNPDQSASTQHDSISDRLDAPLYVENRGAAGC